MTFPTSAEIKAKVVGLVRAHWPICIVLFLACFPSLFLLGDGSYLVHVVGVVGVVIFLPLFKLEKCLWLYSAGFFLSVINDMKPEEARHIADTMGFGWLPSWVSGIIITSVQGAAASFVYLLLLYVFAFGLRGSASLLLRVPICVLFLLASLTPAYYFLWLLIGLTGILGPL